MACPQCDKATIRQSYCSAFCKSRHKSYPWKSSKRWSHAERMPHQDPLPRSYRPCGSWGRGTQPIVKGLVAKRKFAERLVSNMNPAQLALWTWLSAKQLGVRFKPEVVMRGWILDFYCPERKLAVEVDGGYHREKDQRSKDRLRDKVLEEKCGILTLRVTADEVQQNPQEVVKQIRQALLGRTRSAGLPSKRREERAPRQEAHSTL